MHNGPVPTARRRPALWTAGDVNACCGFGTNLLVNLLTLATLLRTVIGLPDAVVFGRILPATATMMLLSTGYYAWLAHRLARASGRDDVCALPSGISVPHLFVVVFVVMLPVKLATGDPMAAWSAGVAWVFVQSFVLMVGAFVAPWVRRVTPQAALLGALAGVSLAFIAIGPLLQIFETPAIGLPCLAIVVAGFLGGARFPGGVPAGVLVVVVGTAIAWASSAFGLHWGDRDLAAVRDALHAWGLHWPSVELPTLFAGLRWPVLAVVVGTAIPFGLYDLIEAMDNVVSAAAAGDEYPTRRVLVADGVVSLIGCLLGNPFINAVYIGHPGWKAMGGRIGYGVATGLAAFALVTFGLLPLAIALVPGVAVAPILVYVGLSIAAQAFAHAPHRHAPAVALAMLPAVAQWGRGLIDAALAAANATASPPVIDAMNRAGVPYRGLATLGEGAILAGIVLGATAAYAIDRAFGRAAYFCLAGAALTFVGLMHGAAIGWASSPTLAAAYAAVAAGLATLRVRPDVAPDGRLARRR